MNIIVSLYNGRLCDIVLNSFEGAKAIAAANDPAVIWSISLKSILSFLEFF